MNSCPACGAPIEAGKAYCSNPACGAVPQARREPAPGKVLEKKVSLKFELDFAAVARTAALLIVVLAALILYFSASR